mmetsp:Transcript_55674/g.132213  ORF Transcript_55674/g.132213 Transcript_55674/m.132213 type:complete len:277 (+) Transcript_55674:154-984(+)
MHLRPPPLAAHERRHPVRRPGTGMHRVRGAAGARVNDAARGGRLHHAGRRRERVGHGRRRSPNRVLVGPRRPRVGAHRRVRRVAADLRDEVAMHVLQRVDALRRHGLLRGLGVTRGCPPRVKRFLLRRRLLLRENRRDRDRLHHRGGSLHAITKHVARLLAYSARLDGRQRAAELEVGTAAVLGESESEAAESRQEVVPHVLDRPEGAPVLDHQLAHVSPAHSTTRPGVISLEVGETVRLRRDGRRLAVVGVILRWLEFEVGETVRLGDGRRLAVV